MAHSDTGTRARQEEVPRPLGGLARWTAAHPAWLLGAGALFVSASAVLIDLSHTSAGTASFYRCALALPFLAVLAIRERRRAGATPPGRLVTAVVAGALFAGDMLLWTQAIAEVGAGLSTVLVNVQVVIVPLLALAVDREPITRRFLLAIPFLLCGVVLAGGVVGGGVKGSDPLAGTVHAVLAAICYSGFLFLLRRSDDGGRILRSYFWVTLSAAVFSLLAGWVWTGVDLTPGWAAVGWLMLVALSGQVLGWLLVAVSSPRLPSQSGAVLLLLTPVGAVVLGAVVLGERPTPLQLAGCVLIMLSVVAATVRRDGRGKDEEQTSKTG
ncbi:DMT family transporter [Sphaerisporangium fuscum]|uniref:DMT family transporter n=1 Tax=Sphaerisporangium fuscum TaxID=2835868 RepID=UPI001BDCBD63|nr:DMT family transporter [Sphaerisporangium fuscum]